MRFLFALAILVCVACPTSAWASSHEPAKPAEAEAPAEGEAPAEHIPGTPGDPAVEMPALIAPMIIAGELQGYVHLSVKIRLNDYGQRSMMLEKIPYLQDAFLREVHGPSIAFNNDPTIVDEAGLIVRLIHVCDGVVGAGVVKTIELRNGAQAR